MQHRSCSLSYRKVCSYRRRNSFPGRFRHLVLLGLELATAIRLLPGVMAGRSAFKAAPQLGLVYLETCLQFALCGAFYLAIPVAHRNGGAVADLVKQAAQKKHWLTRRWAQVAGAPLREGGSVQLDVTIGAMLH